jgi:hypothetical protein
LVYTNDFASDVGVGFNVRRDFVRLNARGGTFHSNCGTAKRDDPVVICAGHDYSIRG